MLELYVVACITARACEYVTAPVSYPTEARCQEQAAIIAGISRGRLSRWGDSFTYHVTCQPQQLAWLQPVGDEAQPATNGDGR